MNHIARFFFNLLDNEEESFYIMLGIFENRGFSTLYLDDLEKLKQFFYVLERLIKLFLPEVSAYFQVI